MRASILLFSSLVFAAGSAAAAGSPVAVYDFSNSFGSSVSGAPALTVTDPLGLSGFGTDTVFGSSDGVYNFVGTPANTSQSGLSLSTVGLLTSNSVYTIELIFKFTEREGGWRRIVDVQNRQSDNGFYVDPSNNLDIFPIAGGSAFSNNVYHDVFLVNDNGNVSFYLDGSAQATVFAPFMAVDSNNLINFFLDNVVAGGQNEYSSGSVAKIAIYDEALGATSIPPPPVAGIPEPGTYALMFAGLGVIAAVARRRKQR